MRFVNLDFSKIGYHLDRIINSFRTKLENYGEHNPPWGTPILGIPIPSISAFNIADIIHETLQHRLAQGFVVYTAGSIDRT